MGFGSRSGQHREAGGRSAVHQLHSPGVGSRGTSTRTSREKMMRERMASRRHYIAENSRTRQSCGIMSRRKREDLMTRLRLVQTEKTAKFEPPRRKRNIDTRSREYLTLVEVRKVRDAERSAGRNGHRDGLLILMLFRHGLRVAEVIALTWDEIHFDDGTLFVRRVKNGRESRHFLEGDEIRQLKQLRRESPASRLVFCSERVGSL